MKQLLRRPCSFHAPRELSNALGIPEPDLLSLAIVPEQHYVEFPKRKPNGKVRTISSPSPLMKSVQRGLLELLYDAFRIPGFMHGGLPGRSIFTHARIHVGKTYVSTFDVRDFYPNTRVDRVREVFATAGFSGQALDIAARVTTLNGSVPQGSPSSGFLANFAFAPIDVEIIRLCKRNGCRYSRFVDDIAISGGFAAASMRQTVIDRIESAGYPIAIEKVQILASSTRQIVTGLVVNEKLRPSKEYVAELKATIRDCQDCGAQHIADTLGLTVKRLKNSLTSRVAWLKQSDFDNARHLRRLLYSVDWKSRRAG